MHSLGDEYTPAEARMIRIFDRLRQRIGEIIMTSADNTVNQVNDQLAKAKGEIDSLLASESAKAVSQENLDKLQSISQALDDIVPDQPAPGGDGGETPEQPAEPAQPVDPEQPQQ